MTPTSKIAESRRKSGVRWTPLVAAWKSPMRGSVHRAVAGSRIHYLLWAREPAAPGERRRDGQFADSPLERDGFELSVPREYDPDKRGARDREFADSPLEGRVMSEPVSEIYGAIPRRLWIISGA